MSGLTVALTADEAGDDQCCDFDLKTRLIIGCISVVLGVVFSFLSFISFSSGDLTTFAIIYTLGIVCSVTGSFFFAGPKKHIEKLKEVAHIVSTIVLIGSIIMVFVSAFGFKSTGLSVLFVIVEVVALFFFLLTLKTLAWKAFKGFFSKLFNCN